MKGINMSSAATSTPLVVVPNAAGVSLVASGARGRRIMASSSSSVAAMCLSSAGRLFRSRRTGWICSSRAFRSAGQFSGCPTLTQKQKLHHSSKNWHDCDNQSIKNKLMAQETYRNVTITGTQLKRSWEPKKLFICIIVWKILHCYGIVCWQKG